MTDKVRLELYADRVQQMMDAADELGILLGRVWQGTPDTPQKMQEAIRTYAERRKAVKEALIKPENKR